MSDSSRLRMPPYAPSSSQVPSPQPRVIRRHRRIMACTMCRGRKVQCDHKKPMCGQCQKGNRPCKYSSEFEFVAPLPPVEAPANEASSDTWKAVVAQQSQLVKKSMSKLEWTGEESRLPYWSLSENEELPRIPAQNPVLPRIELHSPIQTSSKSEYFICNLKERLPARAVCDHFFENFVLSIHPIIPVCHMPTLKLQYLEFWDTLSPMTPVESLVHMAAILYTGAASSTINISQATTLNKLYDEIISVIDISTYFIRDSQTAILMLQGYLIFSTFKASQLAPFSAYGFLPQAIRFGQSLRLHTDSHTGGSIEIEVRRRLWWHLMFLDVESTIATGLPGIIHTDGYTTQLPSILYDTSISNPHQSEGNSNFDPIMIAMQGQWQWTYRMQTWFEKTPDQEVVHNFTGLIEDLLILIPKTDPDTEWPRTYLKLQTDRAYCMLGLRFWQLDQFKGTSCNSEVVCTARSFLTRYLELSNMPQSPHLTWFIPGLVQPIHALIILLMHLSSCNSTTTESLISRQLIDRTFSLRINHILKGTILPPRPIPVMPSCTDPSSPASNPRYNVLVLLYKRVWKKLGWIVENKELRGEGLPQVEMMERAREIVELLETPVRENNVELGLGNKEMEDMFEKVSAADPMDLFQWDEWEALAGRFFP